MTDYTVDADWSGKDNLTSGAALKVVRGSEFQTEFDAIATAIATKYDSSSTVDINAGAIDNTAIGATTASTGNFSTLSIAGTAITSTAAELNILDGVTATTAELNILDGKSFLDEDNMASNSATGIPSQQSVKAYVDAQVSASSVAGITSTADATAITIDSSETVKINGVTVGAGSSTTSDSNSVLGKNALSSVTTGGIDNVAIGYGASANLTTAQDTVAVGYNALTNGGGEYNVAVGSQALGSSSLTSSAIRNTGVGTNALSSLTSGSDNASLGHGAGDIITTGSNNISIGFLANPSSSTASNEITLGNTSITALRCNVTSITSLSDIRDKTNIADLSNCAAFVKELEPVSFDWNRRDESMQGVHAHGFIAQQLKAAQESTGHQIPGLVFEENPEKLEAAYGNLLPTVVAALKEALVEIDELKAKVAALENA